MSGIVCIHFTLMLLGKPFSSPIIGSWAVEAPYFFKSNTHYGVFNNRSGQELVHVATIMLPSMTCCMRRTAKQPSLP